MRIIKVTAPQVRTEGTMEVITLVIGGRSFLLSGADSREVRHVASALHMAKSVTLSVVEHEAFPMPPDAVRR